MDRLLDFVVIGICAAVGYYFGQVPGMFIGGFVGLCLTEEV